MYIFCMHISEFARIRENFDGQLASNTKQPIHVGQYIWLMMCIVFLDNMIYLFTVIYIAHFP